MHVAGQKCQQSEAQHQIILVLDQNYALWSKRNQPDPRRYLGKTRDAASWVDLREEPSDPYHTPVPQRMQRKE